MAKHNKKRNVGLLHEQLVRHASEMTVEGNSGSAETALKILVKFFKKDSELFNEFRLFSALAHPSVPDKDIARKIIQESRRACEKHDPHRLDKEKSQMIREINHSLNRDDFYNQRVENYKIFSTIQALLNEWRGRNCLSPDERVQYEIVLENHLTRDSSDDTLDTNADADPLIFNIMIEKFNKKYSKKLLPSQRNLLENRLLGDSESVLRLSKLAKLEAEKAIKEYYSNCDNEFLLSKKEGLMEKVNNYFPADTDESVTKALLLYNLIDELGAKDV